MSRNAGQPWGFRLQGGIDFGAPLTISKVNGGSPAANAGLMAGDAVLKINEADALHLRHGDAQNAIKSGGDNFTFSVNRGSQIRGKSPAPPRKTPEPPPKEPTPQFPGKKDNPEGWETEDTLLSFVHKMDVKEGKVPAIVNAQFNSPVNIYSEESIAETLSSQTEVLASGVLGVDFKKFEPVDKPVVISDTYKMIHGLQ